MEILRMKSYAKQLNDLTFTDYFIRLKLLAKSVFAWENLPNGMNERWIENFLFSGGKCVFFNDENKGLMVAECNQDGDLNNYQDPVSVTPTGIDVENKSLIIGKDCVLIRNNDEMLPTSGTLQLFAYRLAEISRTIDVNINAQKTPILITTTEKKKLSLKNIYSQWNGNEPVIYSDTAFDPDSLKVFKTDAPIVFPELQSHKLTIWNECLTFLGINNANTEKRERLITEEVSANNEHIDLSADCFLKARQKAADEINKLFKCEISVRKRSVEEIKCKLDTQNTSET